MPRVDPAIPSISTASAILAATSAAVSSEPDDPESEPPPVDEAEIQDILGALRTLRQQLEDIPAGGDRRAHFMALSGEVPPAWVVSGVTRAFDAVGVVGEGCRVLAVMGSDSELAREVGRSNGIQVLIESMVQYAFYRDVAEASVAALRALGEDYENRLLTADFDGVEAVATVMSIYDDDRDLQTACVELLVKTVEGHARRNSTLLGKTPGIRRVLDFLRRFKDDPEAQRVGCKAIGTFVNNCPNNKNAVKHENGNQVIVDAVKAFPDKPEVILHALWTLESLTLHNDANQEIVGEYGMDVMVSLLANADLKQFEALMVSQILRNVTSLHASNQKSFAAQGGVQVMIQSMKRYPGNDDIFLAGCATLYNMRYSDQFERAISQDRAVTFLIEGLQNFGGDPEGLQIAMKTLAACVDCSHAARGQAQESSVAYFVIELLETYEVEDIQLFGLQIVITVASSAPDYVVELADAGAIAVATEALKKFHRSREVLEAAVHLLCVLAENSGVAARLCEEEHLIALVESAKGTCGRFSAAQQHCDTLLSKVAQEDKHLNRGIKSLFTRERSRRLLAKGDSGLSSSLSYGSGLLSGMPSRGNSGKSNLFGSVSSEELPQDALHRGRSRSFNSATRKSDRVKKSVFRRSEGLLS